MRSPLDFGIGSDAPAHIAQASIDLLDPWDDFMLAEMQYPPASKSPAIFHGICGYLAGHLDAVSKTSLTGRAYRQTASQRDIFGTEGIYSQVSEAGAPFGLEGLDLSLTICRKRLAKSLSMAMEPERAELFGRISTICLEASIFIAKCALQDNRHTHSVAMAIDSTEWLSGKRRLITRVLTEDHQNPMSIFQTQLMGYLFELAASSGIIDEAFDYRFYDLLREADSLRTEKEGIDMLGIALACPWEVDVAANAVAAMDSSIKAGLQ